MDLVYLRLRYKIMVPKEHTVRLKDIAIISAPQNLQSELEETIIYQITDQDKNIVVVDIFSVIEKLQEQFKHLEIQPVGPNQSIVVVKTHHQKTILPFVVVIWVLLFIGAAMAIMNFHYDVSMQTVLQKIHFILTGEKEKYPLWIEIPYSFGLGVGMILFFNHLFKKRLNEEPSPLEVEVFNYQQDLDQYVILHENKVGKNDVYKSD